MPPAGPSLRDGVRAGFRLGAGRADGLLLLDVSPAGVARSFVAALLCLPAFLALRLVAWAGGSVPGGGTTLGLLAELIGFVVGWAGFALASRTLAELQGRGADWPRFIAAWNWANVVQYGALLLALLPGALGLPEILGGGLALAGVGYALWLEWFVVRIGLRLSPGRAALMVSVDIAIGLFVSGIVVRVAGGD